MTYEEGFHGPSNARKKDGVCLATNRTHIRAACQSSKVLRATAEYHIRAHGCCPPLRRHEGDGAETKIRTP